MKLIPYTHREHLTRLAGWLSARGMSVPAQELFYDTGFVVDDIVIGFLVKTNSRHWAIDHVAADPMADSVRRDAALVILFDHLEDLAKREGALMVSALAHLPAMRRRFEGRGYGRHGEYGLYYKTLGGDNLCRGSHQSSED